MRLRAGKGELELIAQAAEVGDHDAPLPARVEGEEVQVAFNARYLLDALQAINGDDASWPSTDRSSLRWSGPRDTTTISA